MKDAEERHFDAQQHGGDADFDVGSLYPVGGFDEAGGSEEGNEQGLPE